MLRLAFLSQYDPLDPNDFSGTPYAVRRALKRAGATVVDFPPPPPVPSRASDANGSGRSGNRRFRRVAARLQDRIASGRANRRARDGFLRQTFDDAGPLRERVVEAARRDEIDVVYGCFASTLLYGLNVDCPIVHTSDSTARLLTETYAWAAAMPRWRREGLDDVERDVLHRADAVAVATNWVKRSVVEDYGVDAGRVNVLKLGANLDVPDGADDGEPPPVAGRRVKLVITAADPVRKRLDLAIDATAELRRRGWDARLVFVGPPTERARSTSFVHCAGRLRHSESAERRRHHELIRESHLMIMPSAAEAYGIAPVEAARLGRPSIVTGVGGLPEVVLDGETGIVMPPAAGPVSYATAIENLVAAPRRYRLMCDVARHRARTVLTWDHYAAQMVGLLEHLVETRQAKPPRGRPADRLQRRRDEAAGRVPARS